MTTTSQTTQPVTTPNNNGIRNDAGYYLTRNETGRKNGKFHYQIFDPSGKLLTDRRSNREYVASTICGNYFFGRLDLIGKGDHGRNLKYCESQTKLSETQFNEIYKKLSPAFNNVTFDQFVKNYTLAIKHQSTIAYLKQ